MRCLLAGLFALALPLAATAAPLTPQQKQEIDASVGEWLAQPGAPSVSIAVVSGGEVAYAKAYGKARLAPARPATADTRYAIDSISKEFAAAAMLKLQEEVGELTQAFLMRSGQARAKGLSPEQLEANFRAEFADVLCQLLLMARHHDIDLEAEVERKWLYRLRRP